MPTTEPDNLVQLSLAPPAPKPAAGGDELRLDVQGMNCASCVGHVEKALTAVPGVREARVNLVAEQATVVFDRRQATAQQFIQAIEKAGYHATPADQVDLHGDTADDRAQSEMADWRWRLVVGLLILVPMLVLHFWAASHAWNWAQFVLATAMQVAVGWPYLVSAFNRLRHGAAANMDTLIVIGSLTAYAAGIFTLLRGQHDMYFMDSAMILEFVTLGKYLEARAKRRASQAIRKLLDLSPQEARVERGGETVVVPVEDVRPGERIVVRPGDRVPLDAIIREGTSTVDQAWLTGESIPVDKSAGDELLAGAINGSGSLTAEVTKAAGQTALARVIEMVRRAQESKAESQRIADRIVTWFVPAILVIATLTLLAWGLIGGDWDMAFQAAVAVVVVACPCALGLATPTAILVASGRGAEMGILVKEAHSLETAGKLNVVVLDKTGTITVGKPSLKQVIPRDGVAPDALLATAAAAERLSSHPLAAAIVAAAEDRRIAIPAASDLTVVAGGGVTASIAGTRVLVGNERLFEEERVDFSAMAARLEALRKQGETPLMVAEGGHLLGLVALADKIAPHSVDAIAHLRKLGLRVLLVSGDHRAAVESVAREVGITEVETGVLPERKRDVVVHLQSDGLSVAMVGDGINDAPALAAANLGIAIGAGADVAIETADIVIAGHDLRKVPEAVVLARATLRTIWQNLGWAFVYNLLLVPMATGLLVPFGGPHLPPIAAAAAMSLSSVSVVTNSLLLRRRVKGSG